jgi:hypothetical protein
MVAEVVELPKWRDELEGNRSDRRSALVQAIQVAPAYRRDFEHLYEQLAQLAALPPHIGVSEQTAAIVNYWNERVPGHPAVPMYLWQMLKEDQRYALECAPRGDSARTRRVEFIHGRKFAPTTPNR